ncbi:methylamine utilization protein MauJ [Roseateles aquatilis]|uniref:methylamine utilization protein MauJ n=1 Tax=Roseateles aquatilis TaxID=431061 RepID=UPI00113129EA|nr:methylamine utilization protein MauJ [Roseateles aquatilis]
MTHNSILQISDSEGLGRFVLFDGLSHQLLLKPGIYGNPVLTTQAIYFLDQMESIGHISSESPIPPPDVERLVDNYLFEFSKIHSSSRMTFRTSDARFWIDERSSMYSLADQMLTDTLALDRLNDRSVLEVAATDPKDTINFDDWNIGVNYANAAIADHVGNISSLLEKKVDVRVMPNEERDGHLGKLRVIKARAAYIDIFQALALQDIDARAMQPTRDGTRPTYFPLATSKTFGVVEELSIERITTNKQYSPVLLSHFFSGVKERNPLKAFLAFYNVLEYYFEEAPTRLRRNARSELDQLKCVIELLATDVDFANQLSGDASDWRGAIASNLVTSLGPPIARVDAAAASLCDEFSRWLYEIRCAVVHSKKTRRGITTSSFEPYSAASANIKVALPIVRWLAVLCIEKDQALTNPALV